MNFKNIAFEIISQVLHIPKEEIHPSDKLTDIVKDSIQLFELLIRFEQEFGKSISYEEIAHVETIGDIVNLGERTLQGTHSTYEYQVARTPEEKEMCAALVERIYATQGYVAQNAPEKPTISSHAHTKVFAAYKENVLFGTISIIHDSENGLPLDVLYRDDLAHLRASGKKIAEVGKFAMDHSNLESDGLGAALPLLSLVIENALNDYVDVLCITINPKHDSFYKTLGFTPLGEMKPHPGVNNAPAVLRILNTKDILKNKQYQDSLTISH